MLYVGRSTYKKLQMMGIRTIGDLARAEGEMICRRLGKMGSVLIAFAKGQDDTPVRKENTEAPIKSIGNSTTTPRDLEDDQDVKIIIHTLAESVSARLRENGFRCRTVEISIRDNELYHFTRQKKVTNVTNITNEIADAAFELFQQNYNWERPVRSIGVRGCELVTDAYGEQMSLFLDYEYRQKQMKMDEAVDDIRRRFGYYSIQRGLMYYDQALSNQNQKEEHVVHPHSYF